MEVGNASEPKRQKLEENKDDDDESLPITERMKSVREDISNCLSEWKKLDFQGKMESSGEIFNKVQNRLHNLLRNRGHGLAFTLYYEAKYDDLLYEDEKIKELTKDLTCERSDFMDSHAHKHAGDEFHNCLVKLCKIEEKTNKMADDYRSTNQCLHMMFRGIPEKVLLDADYPVEDYDVIREKMEEMLALVKKGGEAASHTRDLICRLLDLTAIISRTICQCKDNVTERQGPYCLTCKGRIN